MIDSKALFPPSSTSTTFDSTPSAFDGSRGPSSMSPYQTVPSVLALAILWPSWRHRARALAAWRCAIRDAPVSTFQMRTVPSQLPETSRVPQKRRRRMKSRWPTSSREWPVARSQTRMTLLVSADASRPVGREGDVGIGRRCPVSVRGAPPSSGQTRTASIAAARRGEPPVGEIAAAKAAPSVVPSRRPRPSRSPRPRPTRPCWNRRPYADRRRARGRGSAW